MKYYYADASNNPVGPYSLEDLHALNINGVVTPETYVCVEGGNSWQPYRNLQIASTPLSSAALPMTPPPSQSNPSRVSVGNAILWFFCCLPIGFTFWGQPAKGWIWVLISLCTGGAGGLVAIVDYWMSYSAQEKRKLGPWEYFPR